MDNKQTDAFRAAFDRSEDALKQQRRAAPRSDDPANEDSVNINGVDVASKHYVDQSNKQIRDDLNEVIGNIKLPEAAERATTRVELFNNDKQIGAVDGLSHYLMPNLLRLASIQDARKMRMNIALKGELGGGKSTACKQVAEALGLSFDYIGQTLLPHDVIGYMHPVTSEYVWTALTKAFVNGGVVVLEEMDGWSPNATLVANPALANGYLRLPNGEMHERHPDCVIIACMNTWGNGPTADYVGRNKLDAAFMDRFGARLDWKYDAELERAAAGNDDVVDVIQMARLNAKRAGVKVAISPRASIDVAKMMAAGFKMREALNMNCLSSLDADQRRVVLEGCDI